MTSEFIQNITALYFIATQSFVSTNKPPSKKIVLHSFMPRRKIRRGRSVVAPSEQVIQGNVKIFADGQQHAHGRLLFVAFPAVHGIAAYAEYCPELLLRKSPCEPKLPQSISESFHTQTIHENRDLLLKIIKDLKEVYRLIYDNVPKMANETQVKEALKKIQAIIDRNKNLFERLS